MKHLNGFVFNLLVMALIVFCVILTSSSLVLAAAFLHRHPVYLLGFAPLTIAVAYVMSILTVSKEAVY